MGESTSDRLRYRTLMGCRGNASIRWRGRWDPC